MDLKREMVIIDNQIVTNDISYCKYDDLKNIYVIRYKNSNKFYHFSESRVQYITKSTLLNLSAYNFYLHDKLLENIKEIYEFESNNCFYYHVIFSDFSSKNYTFLELKKISKNCYNVLEYMKHVSEVTSLSTEDGRKILCEQMEKIKLEDLNTALANYLKLSNNLMKDNLFDVLIFPFGCNSSQYEAVCNAIYNKISIIEGPPGTGKTQTILNIIANILIRNMNCQVVSNNNTAIENIVEKLEKYHLDFFAALLGRKQNKELFIEQQDCETPKFDECANMDMNEISDVLRRTSQIVRQVYNARKELAILIQRKNELELEYRYFQELVRSQKIELVELKRYNLDRFKLVWNEMLSMDNLSIWDKFRYIFLYKTGSFKFFSNNYNVVLKSLQNLVYAADLVELEEQIKEKENFINSHKDQEDIFIKSSMDYFKKYLSIKYQGDRKKYTLFDILRNQNAFLKDYPVILSTTYSSRNTFSNDFKFDYIIMDEASQIDVVTGTLALSSAKYGVVIGDEKQLPNVVPSDIAQQTNDIFMEYRLDKCYSYSLNSFLSSVKHAIPNIQNKLLVEHYRCHPKIINFCNKKFYNNQLVIMTQDNGESDVIKVIKTNKGNHSRDKQSQRQVDIIKEIISNGSSDIGIIAPYNAQVSLLKEQIQGVEISTVHKFQGREKDTIIISTVDDDISDFVGDSKILNVAISRAKKHLYFVVTGNEIKNTNINDFIDYVDYNNFEITHSKIYSSFDLLYKQYELERLEFFKKHQRILKYDSENIIYHLIDAILKDYENLNFHFHQSLNDLIYDKSLLTEEERRYVTHHNTHIDFYIFKKIGDKPVLAIEVDGYKNHKKGTKQYDRDLMKNRILEKYQIPIIRLKTNGSNEKEIIKNKLEEITKS